MATIAPSAAQNELIKLYLAAFLRAPEYSGYDYWSKQLSAGDSIARVAWTVFSLDVVTDIYPASLSSGQFVNSIYLNVFGKLPDAAGLEYWRGLQDGGMTRGELVLAMINAGLNTSDGTPGKAFIANRYNAAKYAVEQQQTWQGELSPEFLLGAMSGVTEVPTTLTSYAIETRQMAQTTGARGITYSANSFSEAISNDGSLSGPITLVIRGDTFKGELGAVLGKITKTPAGLTATLVKSSDVTATLTLSGKATSHGALNDIANLTVTLTAADLSSGDAVGVSGLVRNDLAVHFYDIPLSESAGLLTGVGQLSSSLIVDLGKDTVTLGGVTTPLREGSIANTSNIDFSAVAAASSTAATGATKVTASVTLRGGSEANRISASPYGGTIDGKEGNDTLSGDAGIDRFIFAKSAADNGNDTINNFVIGKSGDILNFSAFLNKTGTANIVTHTAASATSSIANGDVTVYAGSVTGAADVVALFGAAATFADPTVAGKHVLITANVTGDASIWYITNQTAPTSISTDEVLLAATLVGVNNLQLVGFDITNFA